MHACLRPHTPPGQPSLCKRVQACYTGDDQSFNCATTASPPQQTHMQKAATIMLNPADWNRTWQQPPALTASDCTPALSRASHRQQKPKLPIAADQANVRNYTHRPLQKQGQDGAGGTKQIEGALVAALCCTPVSHTHLTVVLLYPQILWRLPIMGSCQGLSRALWSDSQQTCTATNSLMCSQCTQLAFAYACALSSCRECAAYNPSTYLASCLAASVLMHGRYLCVALLAF
jgi:hypothetical protein